MSIFDRIGQSGPQQQAMTDPRQAMEQMQRAVSDIQSALEGQVAGLTMSINPRRVHTER